MGQYFDTNDGDPEIRLLSSPVEGWQLVEIPLFNQAL